MKIHFFSLTGEVLEPKRVGNSMSTCYTFQDGILSCFWKERLVNQVPAKIGDEVRCPAGGPIQVMKPPGNPVARAAWERGFFKGKRLSSLKELIDEVKRCTRYSLPHGYYIPAATLYVSPEGNCAVSYKAAMGGWVGNPYLWWANESCTGKEIATLIEKALSGSALHIYTNEYALADVNQKSEGHKNETY